MKTKIFAFLIVALIAFIVVVCVNNELYWSNKFSSSEPIREIVGLPSIAVGNLSPAARNPGLELLCTGLYDTPGGYCSYFADGVPFVDFATVGNFTVSEVSK